MAAWLQLSLLGLSAAAVAGQQAASNLTDENRTFDDTDNAACDLGSNCTDGGIPAVRGLCVVASDPGAGKACWDVCNPKHAPMDYRISSNPAMTMSYAGMVETVRAGLNPAVSCPNLRGGDSCPPGDFCPADFLKVFKVPKGRGMCVIDPSEPLSRACWDMCNYRRSVAEFTLGTPEGTGSAVSATRASGVCPGTPWWFYPVVGLCILLLLGCCAGGFWMVKAMGTRKLKSRSAPAGDSRYGGEAEPDMKQDYGAPLREEFHDEMPGDGMMGRGMMEPGMEQQQQQMMQQQQQMMEPMPPQSDYMMQEPNLDYAPPEPQRMPVATEPLAGLYDGGEARSQSHRSMQPFPPELEPPPFTGPGAGSMMPQQPDPTLTSGGGSMRIPGLDEPNLLLNNLPALQVPGQQPQQPYYLGSTQSVQPQVISSFQAQPQVGRPSFTTQMPGYMTGASPPTSMQMQAGVSPGYFTQMQRR